MPRLTKKQIIDYMVRMATDGLFFGDGRDGKAPLITAQNFMREMFRGGAKALRAQLASLSYRQLLQVGMAAVEEIEHAEAQRELAAREANRSKVAAATVAKGNISNWVNEVVAELVGPLLKKHPRWSSNRLAVEIEPRLNQALRARGRPPLAQDAIRKRVKKYRTHAR